MNIQPWDVLPEEFLIRLKTVSPTDRLSSILTSFTEAKPVTFRTNTLKITTEELKKKLEKLQIKVEQVSWYKDAFILNKQHSKEEFVTTNFHKNGLIYIQNLSSMIPALVLNPKRNETICDLTAAPGSKTTQLAALMNNRGKIVANDLSRTRIFRLKDNLKTQGVTNAEVISYPGQALWKRYPETFDKVLVDVPCTMEGRFSTLDSDTYKGWTPKKAKILSKLQGYLLRSAISMTKPGGLIVYSTCTIEVEENEQVINWVLKKERENISLEEVTIPLPQTQCGILHWKNKTFDPQITKTLRILPSETMEGFYVAALRKNISSF